MIWEVLGVFSPKIAFKPCLATIEQGIQTIKSHIVKMAPHSNESKPMYQKDEKALCFHGELLYEAKVLEVRRQDAKDKTSPHEYRVHYKGWKNT